METELRRLAEREDLRQEAVTELLDRVYLYEMPPSLFREAGLLPGRDLRSLDALHLAAALRLGVDVVVTYDERLANAALRTGLRALAPT
jgi:predicted nucleic acid-binding protein